MKTNDRVFFLRNTTENLNNLYDLLLIRQSINYLDKYRSAALAYIFSSNSGKSLTDQINYSDAKTYRAYFQSFCAFVVHVILYLISSFPVEPFTLNMH